MSAKNGSPAERENRRSPDGAPPSGRTGWRRRKGSGLSETRFAILLLVPALALFSLVILYPLVNSLYLGFLDKSLLSPESEFVGLRNIRELLSGEFASILTNTLIFTAGATGLAFVIGFALALVLNAGIRGQGFLRGAFLFPWLIPGVVVSFLWLWIFNSNYGVLNGLLQATGLLEANVNWLSSSTFAMVAIIVAKTWHSFPWMMVMLLAGLQTVPRDLYEAAALDGAGRWQTLLHITVPQLRPVIFIVLILEIIWNFQQFEIIYVMTSGGPAGATTTFSIALYQAAFDAFDLGKAGAIGILWMAILSVIIFVYIRYGESEEVT